MAGDAVRNSDEVTAEGRIEALRCFLGAWESSPEQIAEATGISIEVILSKPLAAEGLGGSEMLGWLSIHHGPTAYRDGVLTPVHRGDWAYFSGAIKGYFTPSFLEWNGGVRRKIDYLILGFRQPHHWLQMYAKDDPYVARYMPINVARSLLHAALRLRFRNAQNEAI